MAKRWTRWLKEPLFQFLVLGALLFAADRYALGQAENPHSIIIDQAKRDELAAIFEEGQGRSPRPQEMQNLIVQWTQNEVLYREALSMNLDQGDDMIRQRLILKMRNVLFNNIVADLPPESQLREWFETNRDRYDRTESFDLEQFALPSTTGASQAHSLAMELAAAPAPQKYAAQLRSYARRPRTNLVHLFGQEGARQLFEFERGAWVALQVTDEQSVGSTPSTRWHLARITAQHAAVPATYDAVKGRVIRDWKDAAKKADLSLALKDIVEKYQIRVIGDEPKESKNAVSQLELTEQP